MSSIIEGYNYDIFISYRQKDNKGDHWVSEFVEALKTELESTFKEEISVYFDINPHDGLLETHDVDASLKEKLKCLIFIPIISRTYCDPKSFAWEHEFKAFVEMASKDQFGLRVKLPNGNVASRVLPIRIYELNNTDIKSCENVLGGYFRGVEFVFERPGVNRPLRPEDDIKSNLNKNNYRDQINKVGNTIEGIISGLLAESEEPLKPDTYLLSKEPAKGLERKEMLVKSIKKYRLRYYSVFAVLVLIFAAVFTFSFFRRDTPENLKASSNRISVAVMPFQNISNDTNLYSLQEIIQESLVNSLSNYSQELIISLPETVNSLISSKGYSYFSLTPSKGLSLSKILDAGILISGNISRIGTTIRIGAKVIDTKNGEVIKSFEVEHLESANELFPKIDTLTSQVTDYLRLSKLKKEYNIAFQQSLPTNSPDAYSNFEVGRMYFNKGNHKAAGEFYSRALNIDSNFVLAALGKAYSALNGFYLYGDSSLMKISRETCLNIYKQKDQMPLSYRLEVEKLNATLFGTIDESIKFTKQIISLDENSPGAYYNLGHFAFVQKRYAEAIPEFEKSLEILRKWDQKPSRASTYYFAGLCSYMADQYDKERRFIKMADRDFPNANGMYLIKASLALAKHDTVTANRYFRKYISGNQGQSASEDNSITNLDIILSKSDIFKKGKGYYDQALSLIPKNSSWIRRMAKYAFLAGDTLLGNQYIKMSFMDAKSSNDRTSANDFQNILTQSGMLEKDKTFYLKAEYWNPDNPYWLHNLSKWMVGKGIDLNHSLILINKAIESQPNEPLFLDTKGWCLYKLGRYNEAVQILELAKKFMEPRKLLEFHQSQTLNQHLEEAKMAIAGTK